MRNRQFRSAALAMIPANAPDWTPYGWTDLDARSGEEKNGEH
jgi:hypothetical protein